MAGSRRKGGKKAKVKNLSLGDLVLAKIKGFPAWPAKVSRPEDWKQEPDPKKYFVQFFGTQEIAFVPPADIQAFTSETKNKLSAKCQIKTKYFVQAVKEICVEYDELHEEKSRGLRDETDISKPGCEASSVDGVSVEVEGEKANLKDGTPAVAPGEEASSEGTIVLASDTGCNSRRGEKNSEEKKACVLSHADDSSCPVMSSEGKQKMCSGEQPKKEVLSPSSSHIKEELSDDKIATVNCAKRTSREDQKSKNMAPMIKKRIEEGQKSSSSGVKLLRDDNSGVCLDRPESEERLKDKGKGKVSGSSTRKFSQDTIKADSNYTVGRKAKELPKTKSNFKATDDLLDTVTNPKAETTGKKKRCEPGLGKPKLGTDEILHPAKKSKVVDVKNDASKGSIGKNMKSNSSVSNNVRDKEVKKSKLKKSTSHVIASRAPTLPSSDVSGDEAVLPLSRRRQQALEGVSDSPALNSDDEIGVNPVELKSETPNCNVKISATRLPKRRRAVCLFIEDEEDEPETPVHDGFARNVEIPSVGSDASQSIDVNHATAVSAQCSVENSTRHENSGLEEASSQLANDFVSPRQPQTAERRPSTDASITPERSEAEESSFKEAKPVLISPRKSPHLVSATKQVEQNRTTKATIKISNNGTQKKALSGSVKVSDDVSDATKSSQNQFLSQRFDVIREDRSGVLTDSKTPDSAMSMKRLIAAAQAKRRQAHTQQYSLGNPSSVFLSRTDVQGASPSPAIQPFPSAIDNVMQVDVQGFAHQTNLVSPSTLGCQSGSHDQQDAEETEERRVSSGRRATGSSLSGGTEAAVARDAFEGMIETLSRTKESIGRATRLAIDCAKYGIANEVVELLIRKLESEASFHRKVDLFFLVDSITQCSHNQKGIAGASYIPTVQTALPRLLGAAAPPGASARENRRQCLKVLRLWLERKILPESFLRRYMDNIGVSNDDTISGFSQRRPSRAERAIDDPIREMEGMVVDEYGSNTTFQLPGFLSSNAFEDEEEEEDVPLSSPCRVADDASPLERVPALGELETCTVTPSDRPHRILEEVDGELEMEDVSGHPKNDRPFTNDGPEMDGQQKGNMELASNSSNEYPPLPEGSPPLPPDSPPPPPPLPPSPSPPPPPSSPCPLPPPPPLPTQLPPLAPPSCPPPSFKPQPPVPPQPSLPSQPILPPQSSIKSSPQLAYQPPAPHEFRGTPNGNQIVQMAGNAPHGGHIDAAVKRELFPISYEFRSVHNEMYLNAHSSQPSQQFQPGNPAFVQRPLPPNLPQTSSSHFSFTKPAMPPNPQHSYPQYSLPPQHDGRRPFVVDEQWRMPAAEYNTDNQHGGWIAGRNPPPCGPLFVREGYFRPPVERPSANNLGFPLTSANNLPAGAPNSGHGVFPCRPDMSAINCWRPA